MAGSAASLPLPCPALGRPAVARRCRTRFPALDDCTPRGRSAAPSDERSARDRPACCPGRGPCDLGGRSAGAAAIDGVAVSALAGDTGGVSGPADAGGERKVRGGAGWDQRGIRRYLGRCPGFAAAWDGGLRLGAGAGGLSWRGSGLEEGSRRSTRPAARRCGRTQRTGAGGSGNAWPGGSLWVSARTVPARPSCVRDRYGAAAETRSLRGSVAALAAIEPGPRALAGETPNDRSGWEPDIAIACVSGSVITRADTWHNSARSLPSKPITT